MEGCAKAEQFLRAAEIIAEVLDQQDEPDVSDAYVTLCVHAGIAASDVACCKRLGVHSRGQDHAAAISLLGQVGRKASQQLGVLLDMKDPGENGRKAASEAGVCTTRMLPCELCKDSHAPP